jgi:hypothetical protein
MATFKEIISRKASLSVILNEFIVNVIICWVIYGLCNWESNPLKWDIITKIFAVLFVCVWCPYSDARRAINKEKKGK